MSSKHQQYTYKNVSEQTQALIGFGEVAPGETITTYERVDGNPNFKLVTRHNERKDTPEEKTDQAVGKEPAEATTDVSNERPLAEDEKAARTPKESK